MGYIVSPKCRAEREAVPPFRPFRRGGSPFGHPPYALVNNYQLGNNERMTLENDLNESREYEMKTYLSSLQSMYDNCLTQNGEIYDIAAKQTQDFTNITAQSILNDSRIIKSPKICNRTFYQSNEIWSVLWN